MMNVDCMQANLIYAQIVKTGIKLSAAMVYNASTCGTCAMEKVIAGIPAMKTVAVQVTSRSRVCLTCVARLLIAAWSLASNRPQVQANASAYATTYKNICCNYDLGLGQKKGLSLDFRCSGNACACISRTHQFFFAGFDHETGR
jgi:hypothetical protein